MKTILVVDDEPNLRRLVAATLADDDYRILQAADGEAAVAMAFQERPDLVLLDWRMPGISGLEVATQLRANPDTCNAHIMMITAIASQADQERAAAIGIDGYLVKPFSPLELMHRVHAVLGR